MEGYTCTIATNGSKRYFKNSRPVAIGTIRPDLLARIPCTKKTGKRRKAKSPARARSPVRGRSPARSRSPTRGRSPARSKSPRRSPARPRKSPSPARAPSPRRSPSRARSPTRGRKRSPSPARPRSPFRSRSPVRTGPRKNPPPFIGSGISESYEFFDDFVSHIPTNPVRALGAIKRVLPPYDVAPVSASRRLF